MDEENMSNILAIIVSLSQAPSPKVLRSSNLLPKVGLLCVAKQSVWRRQLELNLIQLFKREGHFDSH